MKTFTKWLERNTQIKKDFKIQEQEPTQDVSTAFLSQKSFKTPSAAIKLQVLSTATES